MTGAIACNRRLASTTSATASGSASISNRLIFCSAPLSKTLKSFCVKSSTNSPFLSITVTGTVTSFTRARIGFFDCGVSSTCRFPSESVRAYWCRACVGPADESATTSTDPAHIVLSGRRMSVLPLLIQERQFLLPAPVAPPQKAPEKQNRVGLSSRNDFDQYPEPLRASGV